MINNIRIGLLMYKYLNKEHDLDISMAISLDDFYEGQFSIKDFNEIIKKQSEVKKIYKDFNLFTFLEKQLNLQSSFLNQNGDIKTKYINYYSKEYHNYLTELILRFNYFDLKFEVENKIETKKEVRRVNKI